MLRPVLFLAAACICIATGVKAEDLIGQPPTQIVFDRGVCRQLVVHHPSAGVTYTPGVSVEGHPVTPADLPKETLFPDGSQLAKQVTIPVTRELVARLGSLHPYFKAEATIGLVEVDEAGKLLFNGQPVEAGNEAILAELCRNAAATD
jgi:hypothetical protein